MSEVIVRYFITTNPTNEHARWSKLTAGPFQDRAMAERALANLASNPDFRGGEIVENTDED